MAETRKPLIYNDGSQIEARLSTGERLATIARSIGRAQPTAANESRMNQTTEPRGRLVAMTRNSCVSGAIHEGRGMCDTGCDLP